MPLGAGSPSSSQPDHDMARPSSSLPPLSPASIVRAQSRRPRRSKISRRRGPRASGASTNCTGEELGLGQAAQRADSLATDLSRLTQSLNRISERLEAGEGTLGKALASPALHDSLLHTVGRLDALIAEIKANPKKFVSFSLF